MFSTLIRPERLAECKHIKIMDGLHVFPLCQGWGVDLYLLKSLYG